nr:hypothetical protein CoNPh37_CDS0058 [Staphylococcus phage S-CoN_Ph37]
MFSSSIIKISSCILLPPLSINKVKIKSTFC